MIKGKRYRGLAKSARLRPTSDATLKYIFELAKENAA
jgi:hypothetical protein